MACTLPGRVPDTIDIVFEPSREAALELINPGPIWHGTLRYEDLPVTRGAASPSQPASAPAEPRDPLLDAP